MKQGMRLIAAKSIDEKESIVICGNENEWATYIRVDSNDYYGHYFKDYDDAYEDFHSRIKSKSSTNNRDSIYYGFYPWER